MPTFSALEEAGACYSVLAHEATHWTGNEQHLARQLGHRFGAQAYVAEEPVTELGRHSFGPGLASPVNCEFPDYAACFSGVMWRTCGDHDREATRCVSFAPSSAETASRLPSRRRFPTRQE
jgi:antirestriction protein ArdC